jgi:hypothetical protein
MDMHEYSQHNFIMAVNFENDEASLSGMNYTGRSLYLGNSLQLQLDGLGRGTAAGDWVDPQYGNSKGDIAANVTVYNPPASDAPSAIAHSFLLYTRVLVIKPSSIEIQE